MMDMGWAPFLAGLAPALDCLLENMNGASPRQRRLCARFWGDQARCHETGRQRDDFPEDEDATRTDRATDGPEQ
jgi:hypothetical protein